MTTGWPPGLLQDDDRGLSRWLANRIDSRLHAREAAQRLNDPVWRQYVRQRVAEDMRFFYQAFRPEML